MIVERIVEDGSDVSTYLVGEGDRALMIDVPMRLETLEAKVKERGWKIEAILLTHGHLRHAGRAAEAAARFGAPILAHRDELPLLQRLPAEAERHGFCGVHVPQITRFAEESETTVGSLRVGVFSTPGHTPGSLSFRIGDHLFTGDLQNISTVTAAGRGVKKICPGHGIPFDPERLSARGK